MAGVDRTATDRRARAQDRSAHDGERFFKKSVAAFQGSSSASRRQWRGCLFEEVRQAAAKGEAVSALCQMTGISRASYYRWGVPRPSFPVEMELRDAMQQVALQFPFYGYRRVTVELNHRGCAVNHKRVLRMMRQDNLLCLRHKSFVVTTDSRHNLPVYPNRARDIVPSQVNQLWVADITYIRLCTEFIYLAVVLDAFSRRVIGWALGRTLEAGLAVSALHMALRQRRPEAGLVHHSDRGVQYASLEYTGLLKEHQIEISMSRKGNPY
ncbi:MAG: IS3 family transposase, partial [Bryobacteraceae bacterium]